MAGEVGAVGVGEFLRVTYFVGNGASSRPLLAADAWRERWTPANPNAEWNRWFSTLPASGDYGHAKSFSSSGKR